MARPSKLTPDQWAEVERRVTEGEAMRPLAKEFGVDEAAIRRRVNPHTPQIRSVAVKLAEVKQELEALPVRQQYMAMNLADKLRNISTSIASAAELGAATAHRLHALANAEVSKVDDAAPMADKELLQGVSVLIKMGNDAAANPINLLHASKDRLKQMDEPPPEDATPARPQLSREEWERRYGVVHG